MKIFEVATLGAVAIVAAAFLLPADSSASVAPSVSVGDSGSSTLDDWMFTLTKKEWKAHKKSQKRAFKAYRKSQVFSSKAERKAFCKYARAQKKSMKACLKSQKALIGNPDCSPSDLQPCFTPDWGWAGV